MELLDELKARFDKEPKLFSQATQDDAKLQVFQQTFPASRLVSLTLDDYCLGHGSKPNSFSWWIERGLQPVLGRYMPGTSRGHLIYRQKDGTYYKHRKLADLTDEAALKYVMALTSGIAGLESLEDGKRFDPKGAIFKALKLEPRMTMGEARWLRIFGAYHPDDVVPVNSPQHIEHFLIRFGVPESDIDSGTFGRALQLWKFYLEAREKLSGLTPWGFARLLYDDELGLTPPSSFPSEPDVDPETLADTDESARNVILYGPPGTGKTYQSVDYAVRILEPASYKGIRSDRKKVLTEFNRLRAEGRVAFVTFHQSFSYEEFVEGLKADTDDNGQIVYRPTDGIFKKICDAAASRQVQHTDRSLDPKGRPVWKMSLGNTLGVDVFDECVAAGVAALGFGTDIDFTGCANREEVKDRFRAKGIEPIAYDFAVTAIHHFKNSMKRGDLIVVSEGNLKFRAIGEVTGDYEFVPQGDIEGYHQRRKVDWVRVYAPSLPVEDVLTKAFSQQSIYTLSERSLDKAKLAALLSKAAPTPRVFSKSDKVGSYVVEEVGPENLTVRKPQGGSLPIAWAILDELAAHVKAGRVTVADIKEGEVFKKTDSTLEKHIVNGYANLLAPAVERMLNSPTSSAVDQGIAQTRVLIIDEINRGNVSKIFGELITLIEDNKREGQPEALSVMLPYSRKSFAVPSNLFIVGTMNTADRSLTGLDVALRRRFQMVQVPPDPSLLKGVSIEGVDLYRMLTAINQRLELMIGSDLLIGHSYFLPLRNDASLDALKTVFTRALLPLLQEYFFEDGAKIHQVLGDHWKPSNLQFYRRQLDEAQIHELLGEDWNMPVGSGWRLNETALTEPEAYRGIYERLN